MTLNEQKQLASDCIQFLHSAFDNKLGGAITVFKNSISILISVPNDFSESLHLYYMDGAQKNTEKLKKFITEIIDRHYES